MIRYYKTVEGRTKEIKEYAPQCWINCTSPTEEEIEYLISNFSLDPEFARSALDEEESSHVDSEDENVLMIVDSPVVNHAGKNLTYYTMPLSIIITPQNIITISIKENSIIEEFSESLIRNVRIEDKNRFALQIMLRMAGKYLQYLKQINKITERVEEKLKKTQKNEELMQFLEIEKSLVYFSASLRSIRGMIGKIKRGKYIKFNEEEHELIEDLSIEFTQAQEMSEIYMSILSSTMDTFSSVISNNLNVVMKILASITLISSMPTIISGIYGMNNPGIPLMEYWWAPFIIMGVLSFGVWAIL
ncbi:MAG: magnesium transporter CorA family protein, partial [Clostridia bacterium]|nr:magnesium transporter CorA family protein [Clostridia bacterium]